MDLPMPLDEIKRQVEVLLATSRSNDVLYIRDADSPIPSIGWHLQHISLDNDPTLKKLNQFADIIGGMNPAGHYLLCKALSTDYRQGLDDLLRTAANINPGCMDRYEVIPEATTHQALGQWLVEHDRLEERVPKTLRPYLDYRSIGVAYCIEHEGELLPTGYTGIQKDSAKQIQEKHGTIRLTLISASGTFELDLPATDRKLTQAVHDLGVPDITQAHISKVEFSPAYLTDLIPLDRITVTEANSLAQSIRNMEHDGYLAIYCAVLEAEKPETFDAAADIIIDLNDYEFVPEDLNEYAVSDERHAASHDGWLSPVRGGNHALHGGSNPQRDQPPCGGHHR